MPCPCRQWTGPLGFKSLKVKHKGQRAPQLVDAHPLSDGQPERHAALSKADDPLAEAIAPCLRHER